MLEKIGLYFITDSSLTKNSVIEDCRIAIDAGVQVIQYREKKLKKEQMLEEALEISRMCRNAGVVFIVNDDIETAHRVNADGVHLGQEDMPIEKARSLLGNKIIGITVHNLSEAIEAEKKGADYLGASPIFHTDTKKDAGKPIGCKALAEIKSNVKIPVIAIGGIKMGNLEEVIRAGVDGVCMISAIVGKENMAERIRRVEEIIRKARDKK